MLSSGVIAEADGRAAAAGGWSATVALALEADGLFNARQQVHSGAAASSPAAGAPPSCRSPGICFPSPKILRSMTFDALQACEWQKLRSSALAGATVLRRQTVSDATSVMQACCF